MILTPSEQMLLQQAIQFLEATRHLESIPEAQVPQSLLVDLMSSDTDDLGLIGCDLASRIEPNVDLSYLGALPAAARNYARFLLARQSAASILKQNPPAPLRTEVSDLAGRIPPASKAAARKVNSMTIIVHGTWAQSQSWWQKGSSFWTYINNQVQDVYAGSSPFRWSGDNQHTARVRAARELVDWVQNHPSQSLRVIAHSHGGNVAMHASRLGLKMQSLILLGTPTRLEYIPDLREIDVLHHVFSLADTVQLAGSISNRRGGDARTLADSATLINHRATDDGNGREPGHSDLHEPATWSANNFDRLLA